MCQSCGNMYLILTEFKICTTSYGLSFFLFAYHAWAIKQHEKKRIHNFQYGRRNEVSKIFIISLRLIWGALERNLLESIIGEYGPQNWPITTCLLTERYNNNNTKSRKWKQLQALVDSMLTCFFSSNQKSFDDCNYDNWKTKLPLNGTTLSSFSSG